MMSSNTKVKKENLQFNTSTNIQQELIDKSTQPNNSLNSKTYSQEKQLLILGDRNSGKSSLTKIFQNETLTKQNFILNNKNNYSSNKSSGQAINFSYLNVYMNEQTENGFGDLSMNSSNNVATNSAIVSRLNIIEISELIPYSIILPFLKFDQQTLDSKVNKENLHQNNQYFSDLNEFGIAIVLDLSFPDSILKSLNNWIQQSNGLMKYLCEQKKIDMNDDNAIDNKIQQQNLLKSLRIKEDLYLRTFRYYYSICSEKENNINKTQNNISEDVQNKSFVCDNELKLDENFDSERFSCLRYRDLLKSSELMNYLIDNKIENFGVPLFVIGAKSDVFEKLYDSVLVPLKLEMLTYCLRKVCLRFGASLFYVKNLNDLSNSGTYYDKSMRVSYSNAKFNFSYNQIKVLLKYIFHRLYDFELPSKFFKPKIFGLSEMSLVFIPSGFDTENTIKSTQFNSNNDNNQMLESNNVEDQVETKKPLESSVEISIENIIGYDGVWWKKTFATQNNISKIASTDNKPISKKLADNEKYLESKPNSIFMNEIKFEMTQLQMQHQQRLDELASKSKNRIIRSPIDKGINVQNASSKKFKSRIESEGIINSNIPRQLSSLPSFNQNDSSNKTKNNSISNIQSPDSIAMKNFFQSLLNSDKNKSSKTSSPNITNMFNKCSINKESISQTTPKKYTEKQDNIPNNIKNNKSKSQ